MALVLPREEEVENMFSRILSSEESCERLMETFYDHLCDDKREMDADPQHFAEVLLNAYKNGDVSALLLELCNRSMFDLLKEAYLSPAVSMGKAARIPFFSQMLKEICCQISRTKLPDTNIRNFMKSMRHTMLRPVPNYIWQMAIIWSAIIQPACRSAKSRKTKKEVF